METKEETKEEELLREIYPDGISNEKEFLNSLRKLTRNNKWKINDIKELKKIISESRGYFLEKFFELYPNKQWKRYFPESFNEKPITAKELENLKVEMKRDGKEEDFDAKLKFLEAKDKFLDQEIFEEMREIKDYNCVHQIVNTRSNLLKKKH